MTTQILIAGFGGQGILFAGKFLANKGLLEGRLLDPVVWSGNARRHGKLQCCPFGRADRISDRQQAGRAYRHEPSFARQV